jgi:hypothetical protein
MPAPADFTGQTKTYSHPTETAPQRPDIGIQAQRVNKAKVAALHARYVIHVGRWTSREPREIRRSHLNYVVPDTQKWEQSAVHYIDTHPATEAFVKNAGLGFAIPYLLLA